MKILHTSDWHLGQNLFTKSRKEEHQAFMHWLLTLVKSASIDAVIIAGDVFDTGTPPSYARELYNQFVVDLQQLDCVLVVLGGNHDSVSTLNESKQILACLNTFVISNTADNISDQLLTIANKDGSIGAIICAIPFIRPRDVLQSHAGDQELDKRKALSDAIKQHYHQLYALAVKMKSEQDLQVPIIMTGHLTALGVAQSESVRDIYIGTLEGFAADGFPPADYIALGHIHTPQVVAKSDHIRYCGSPLPLRFDELNKSKQVLVVEFNGDIRQSITPIAIPTFQPMQVLKGDLAKIDSGLKALTSPASEQTIWLSIEVETEDYLSDLQQRVQDLVEGMDVEILQLRRMRGKARTLLKQDTKQMLSELEPIDVFKQRMALEKFDTAEDQDRSLRIQNKFKEILSEVVHQEGGQ